jgi:very-short-patch-repair endonuclease
MNSRQQLHYEQICSLAKQKGWQVVSDTYIKSNIKMQFICDRGHTRFIRPYAFKNGDGCAECSRNCPMKSKSLFDQLVKDRGYKVLGEYLNNDTKVEMLCPSGHNFKIAPHSFKSNIGCPVCSGNCSITAMENFRKQAADRNYQVIGKYANNWTKIEMVCPNGHSICISSDNFIHGVNCSECTKYCPIPAKREFLRLAQEYGYQIKSRYIDNETPVEMICSEGHSISVKPHIFKNGHRCIVCAGTCPIRAEQEYRRMALLRGYQIMGSYSDTKTPTKMTCNAGHEIEMSPYSFRSGSGCIVCAGSCPIQAERDFKTQAESRKYKITGSYVNSRTAIAVICPAGHVTTVVPSTFKAGAECIVCCGHCPETSEREYTLQANNREYQIIGQYINSRTKVAMICPSGHQIQLAPYSFKTGTNCPICNLSKGEELIKAALVELGYFHVPQYRLPSFKRRAYDFGCRAPNGQTFVIEWDGIQHFMYDEERSFVSTQEELLHLQEIDRQKTGAIMELGHHILRFDYTWLTRPMAEIIDFITASIMASQLLCVTDPDKYLWLTCTIKPSTAQYSDVGIKSESTSIHGALVSRPGSIKLKIRTPICNDVDQLCS